MKSKKEVLESLGYDFYVFYTTNEEELWKKYNQNIKANKDFGFPVFSFMTFAKHHLENEKK